MSDEVDPPGQDPQAPRQGDGLGRDGGEAHAAAPFKHTWWQRLIRDLYRLYGPAQTGLPPYATPEEREAWRIANRPEPKESKPALPPPGYEIAEYRDGQGYVHRSLVPKTLPAAPHGERSAVETEESSSDNAQD